MASVHLLIASHKLCWAAPGTTPPEAGTADGSPADRVATDGGFGAQVGALAALFDRTSLCVPVASEPGPAGLTTIDDSIELRPLPAATGTGWRRRVTAVRWFVQLVGEVRRVDAVHAPLPGDVGTLAAAIAVALRRPLFVRHCATWDVPVTRADRIVRRALERVAGGRTVVMATGAAEGPPSPDVPAITWIFSTTLADDGIRAEPRRAPAPGTAQLVTGGRLIEAKGTDTVLDAFARLRADGAAEHLHVVGDGPARANLERRAERLGIADHVTFHGKVAAAAVPPILDLADVFVYPTRSAEGFPKLVLEAVARGLPVVATPVSAIPRIIDGAGTLVPADAGGDDVAAAVADVLADGAGYAAASHQAITNAHGSTLTGWQAAIGERLAEAWGRLRTDGPDTPEATAEPLVEDAA